MKPEEVSTALFNLSKMESAMYAEREQLLNEGKTFSTVSLEKYYSQIADDKERELAKRFANAIKADFDSNGDLYWKEFVTERESTHGFVLWTGDVPVDEFNFGILGDTGGYARRMRDNKAQSEAFSEEIKMLGNLANIKSGADLVTHLEAVYHKIAEYDGDKAKQATLEKAIVLLKFYKEASFTDYLPVGGPLARMLTKTSAAQLAYGKGAMSLGPSEIETTLIQLRDKDLISEEGFKEARNILLAEKKDMSIEIGSAVTQFMALALALYIMQQLFESEKKEQTK
jgi:hypothetical protein